MPAPADPLDQLRDIHLPDPVSYWPPAPGWWVVAAIVLLIIATTAIVIYKRYQANAYRREAASKLNTINQLRVDGDQREYLQQLNHLLKQTALTIDEREAISSLSGKDWLQFLDRSANTSAFTDGAGSILANGPYQSIVDEGDLSALHQLAELWIKEHQLPC
jgi:hypothetical protein